MTKSPQQIIWDFNYIYIFNIEEDVLFKAIINYNIYNNLKIY